jgi:cell division protein FtsQ
MSVARDEPGTVPTPTGHAPARPRKSLARRVRAAGIAGVALVLVASPWWVKPALARLDFFRVRRVEVVGARYANANEIVSRLGVDSTASVWDDVRPLEERVRRLPSVRDVHIGRRLPGTLVIQLTENPPVALVPSGGTLVAVDDRGRTLRIDPTAVNVDLPVLRNRDSVALRLLGEVRSELPALFARIGDVRRNSDGSIAIRLNTPTPRVVLAAADLSMDRLFDVIPVEADLARRKLAAEEIDLRFKDQVVVRLP